MDHKFDLVIIGGGVLGTFSAYHALQSGKTVALVDRHSHPFGASVRNFGQIVPSGLNAQWKPYGLKSLEIYSALQQAGDFTVRPFGSVYVASDDDEMTLIGELYEKTDVTSNHAPRMLTGDEACARWKGLRADYCKDALFFPDELSVDPRRLVSRVQSYLSEKHELAFYPKNIVQAIEAAIDGSYKVITNTGLALSGEKILICSGADYQHIFPKEYEADAISAVKIHMLMTKPQPSQRLWGNILSGLSIRRYEAFQECASYAAIMQKNDRDPRIAQWGIHILFKQTDEGHIIIGDAHHYSPGHAPEQLGFDLEEDVKAYILELAREIMDLETWQLQASWYGVYTQGVHEPVYYRQPQPGIHILNAIGGKGMTAGPGYTYSFVQNLFDT